MDEISHYNQCFQNNFKKLKNIQLKGATKQELSTLDTSTILYEMDFILCVCVVSVSFCIGIRVLMACMQTCTNIYRETHVKLEV